MLEFCLYSKWFMQEALLILLMLLIFSKLYIVYGIIHNWIYLIIINGKTFVCIKFSIVCIMYCWYSLSFNNRLYQWMKSMSSHQLSWTLMGHCCVGWLLIWSEMPNHSHRLLIRYNMYNDPYAWIVHTCIFAHVKKHAHTHCLLISIWHWTIMHFCCCKY